MNRRRLSSNTSVHFGKRVRVRTGRNVSVKTSQAQTRARPVYPPALAELSNTAHTPTQITAFVMAQLYQFLDINCSGFTVDQITALVNIGSRHELGKYSWQMVSSDLTINSLITDLKQLIALFQEAWPVYSSTSKETAEQKFQWIKCHQILTNTVQALTTQSTSESDKSMTSASPPSASLIGKRPDESAESTDFLTHVKPTLSDSADASDGDTASVED